MIFFLEFLRNRFSKSASESFIARWSQAEASERANAQQFLLWPICLRCRARRSIMNKYSFAIHEQLIFYRESRLHEKHSTLQLEP